MLEYIDKSVITWLGLDPSIKDQLRICSIFAILSVSRSSQLIADFFYALMIEEALPRAGGGAFFVGKDQPVTRPAGFSH